MRFLLVDRLTSLEPRQSVSGVKNLSTSEEYLADHFPGFPVMPGVMMVETLVQAGAWLMRFSEDFAYSTVLLKQARAVKFNNFVTPGRMLEFDLRVHAWDGSECTFKAAGEVDGKSAITARLTLEQSNLAEQDPGKADLDRRLVESARVQFEQIWKPGE